MKAVILAGGFGSRLTEETKLKPKPMVEIGGKPILWHIMKMYSKHGVNDFIICCGYKGHVIKEYFFNYFLYQSDVTFLMKENKMEVHDSRVEPWKVTLIDTGENVQTGGRLAAVSKHIENEDVFCFTYGDGISDVDISASIDFHKKHRKLATLVAISPPGRFGVLDIKNGKVNSFKEKPKIDQDFKNGGFFVLSPHVLKMIAGPECVWEHEPLTSLAREGQLMAYEHSGFWHPIDTQNDQILLEALWKKGEAPWKTW
jgi:glucose-1-phosphate cytidylyltransferase